MMLFLFPADHTGKTGKTSAEQQHGGWFGDRGNVINKHCHICKIAITITNLIIR